MLHCVIIRFLIYYLVLAYRAAYHACQPKKAKKVPEAIWSTSDVEAVEMWHCVVLLLLDVVSRKSCFFMCDSGLERMKSFCFLIDFVVNELCIILLFISDKSSHKLSWQYKIVTFASVLWRHIFSHSLDYLSVPTNMTS